MPKPGPLPGVCVPPSVPARIPVKAAPGMVRISKSTAAHACRRPPDARPGNAMRSPRLPDMPPNSQPLLSISAPDVPRCATAIPISSCPAGQGQHAPAPHVAPAGTPRLTPAVSRRGSVRGDDRVAGRAVAAPSVVRRHHPGRGAGRSRAVGISCRLRRGQGSGRRAASSRHAGISRYARPGRRWCRLRTVAARAVTSGRQSQRSGARSSVDSPSGGRRPTGVDRPYRRG